MKKKLFVAIFLVMFVVSGALTMNVLGVDPNQFTGSDTELGGSLLFDIPDEEGATESIFAAIIFIFITVLSFIYRIKILKVDKDDEKKIKSLKTQIRILCVIGMVGMLLCMMSIEIIIFCLIMILSFILKEDKDKEKEIKNLKREIKILYVIGMVGMVLCMMYTSVFLNPYNGIIVD